MRVLNGCSVPFLADDVIIDQAHYIPGIGYRYSTVTSRTKNSESSNPNPKGTKVLRYQNWHHAIA